MWGSWDNIDKIRDVVVRDPKYFNWTTIMFLAIVVFIYNCVLKKKDYKMLIAGISLYSIHWFYEIMNAIIYKVFGAPLWTCTNESTSFLLLIGVSIELSFMFSIAGMVAWLMLPEDRTTKWFKIPCKWVVVIGMSILFSVIEIFLAWTGHFLWAYSWWGAIPVCITTYVPFFIGAVFIPDASPKFQKIFLPILIGVNILLLAILIPLGII